jgi:hypothetical protein
MTFKATWGWPRALFLPALAERSAFSELCRRAGGPVRVDAVEKIGREGDHDASYDGEQGSTADIEDRRLGSWWAANSSRHGRRSWLRRGLLQHTAGDFAATV